MSDREGKWFEVEADRLLYVGRGRDAILCDRLEGSVIILIKLTNENAEKLQKVLSVHMTR